MANPGPTDPPELADVGRLARRLLNRATRAARTEDQPLRRLLLDHLGPEAAALPTVSGSWASYEHVNVQLGLEAWLEAAPGAAGKVHGERTHDVVGITGVGYLRHMDVGIGDLLQPSDGPFSSAGFGGVMTVALPIGPGEQTHACVSHGIYLVDDGGARLAIAVLPMDRGMDTDVVVQVAGPDQDRIQAVLGEIRALSTERSVFRGQVISFGPEVFGSGRQVPMNFLERPSVGRDQIVLPDDVLANIERQVLGVGRHSGRLLASGQHLRRGVLLHGAPGTGKTHTVGYLLGQLPEATVIVISGRALNRIREACSVARSLQPAVVVIEDVDLIAEQRQAQPGEHPLLFQLLNEMDGLNAAADVLFLLTTNRPDLLEPALADRPGRVDLAAELPLPDAGARRQLIRLYQGRLVLDLARPETVIERTEGVTAAFLKELLRKAALLSAEQDGAEQDGAEQDGAEQDGAEQDGAHDDRDGPIRVTDAHLDAALDQLLDIRNQLTRVLLGGDQPGPKPQAPQAPQAPKPPNPEPVSGSHAVR